MSVPLSLHYGDSDSDDGDDISDMSDDQFADEAEEHAETCYTIPPHLASPQEIISTSAPPQYPTGTNVI